MISLGTRTSLSVLRKHQSLIGALAWLLMMGGTHHGLKLLQRDGARSIGVMEPASTRPEDGQQFIVTAAGLRAPKSLAAWTARAGMYQATTSASSNLSGSAVRATAGRT